MNNGKEYRPKKWFGFFIRKNPIKTYIFGSYHIQAGDGGPLVVMINAEDIDEAMRSLLLQFPRHPISHFDLIDICELEDSDTRAKHDKFHDDPSFNKG